MALPFSAAYIIMMWESPYIASVVLVIRRFLLLLEPTFGLPILDKVPFSGLQKQGETEEQRN